LKSKRDLELLKMALNKSDLKTIQVISHKIRGHALGYGFAPLSQICTQIEHAAIEGRSHIINLLLDEYTAYIENVDLK